MDNKRNRFLIFFMTIILLSAVPAWSQNLALGRPVTVSSTEASYAGSNAVDGNTATRWSSDFSDPQWIAVDLGSSTGITRVVLRWETAYGRTYTIQVSNDNVNWSTALSVSASDGGVDDLTLTATGRYVRMYGTARGTAWGYSLWEFEVYGGTVTATPTMPNTATPTRTPTPTQTPLKTPTSPSTNLALNKTALSSSDENAGLTANYAVDGDTGTRWASAYSDPQWLQVDLGATYTIARIVLRWETAYGSAFQIQVSANASAWITIYSTTSGMGGVNDLPVSGAGRYVRIYGTSRGTGWGYSLWEFEVYGTGGATSTPTRTPTPVAATSTSTRSPTPVTATATPAPTIPANVNLALNKPAAASSIEGAGMEAGMAFDGNTGTRWSSAFSDPQWVQVDLGTSVNISRVVLRWETAAARSYQIQVSQDGANWTSVYSTTSGAGGTETLNVSGSGRYVRMYGTARTTAWGYSLWEFEVYGAGVPVNVPVTGPYAQYLEIQVSPADLNGTSTFKTQNTEINTTLSYNEGTAVTMSVYAMVEQKVVVFNTYSANNVHLTGNPLTFTVHSSSSVTVDLQSVTPTPTVPGGTQPPTATATPTPTLPAGSFSLISPANGAMVTSTRKPVFTWNGVSGATSYQVWVNITRTDYDWRAPGNLLDRYTQVGTINGTSFTMSSDLTDRWTYRWYVVAIATGGNKTSNIGQFSVYIPYMEQAPDGINIVNGCRDTNKNGFIEPFEDWHNSIETRLNDLMSRLTQEEKFKQCFYGGESDPMNGFSFSYGVEGGMTELQYAAAKTRMGIPMAFAGDKIHGWKTIFPTQLGLAATRDMNIVYQCGNLQRVEQKSFGFTGTLMPLAEVNTKVLYPRFQEGCGENADDAAAILRAIVCGMQGGPEPNPHSILVTVKHWPSQGAGGEVPLVYDAVTVKYHMKPWYAAVDANAASVMPGYSSAPFLDPTGAGANSSAPIIDYLRNTIGFKGFIVTDWLAAATDTSITSMGAGVNVMGGAPSANTDLNQLVAAIGQAKLDDSARRVLNMKLRLGLFENPYGDPTASWSALENHNIVLNAARKSITLIKNNGVLPLNLSSGDNMIVGGPRATWLNSDYDPNVIWQSIYYSDPYQVNYLEAFQDRSASRGVNVYLNDASNARVAVVVIGEQSYTHATEWADRNPNIPADQLSVITNLKSRGIPVVTVVISPRPYVLTDVVNNSDAVMLVYRGGTAIEQAVAEMCYGDFSPSGKLPFQLPRSDSQIGTDVPTNQLEKWDLPYDLGATDAQRNEIRNYINNNQTVPTNYGDPLFPYSYGLTY